MILLLLSSITTDWLWLLIFTRFIDHTQRRTTVGRTPLNEWSVRRRDLYLTTHNNHNKHPCSPRRAEDFYLPLKFRRLRPGLNPRTWVPKASTLPLDHRSLAASVVCDELITRSEESHRLWCVVECDLGQKLKTFLFVGKIYQIDIMLRLVKLCFLKLKIH